MPLASGLVPASVANKTWVNLAEQITVTDSGHLDTGEAHTPVRVVFFKIPAVGSMACGDQRLHVPMRGSMEPRIEQLSR